MPTATAITVLGAVVLTITSATTCSRQDWPPPAQRLPPALVLTDSLWNSDSREIRSVQINICKPNAQKYVENV